MRNRRCLKSSNFRSDTLQLAAGRFIGFVTSLGTGDVLIVLERNGRPIALLNTSYTTAKSLVEKLGGLITVLEQKTGNPIMTIDEITTKMGEKHKKEINNDATES
ncbi:MAG: hypothetical protein ACM3SR_16890 [Ignavibacteriales bacterium]